MFTPDVVEWFGGYALALVAGYAIGAWLLARQHRGGDASARCVAATAGVSAFRSSTRGGGRRRPVAASKIPALLAAGADVTVIAPEISGAINRSRVTAITGEFQASDLDGAWFVTAAATPEVNRAVREAADARGVFVNAVDDPANATAYLGGTINRGGVTVAFSTSGQAPALAGLLREAFDELVPPDIGAWAERAVALKRRSARGRRADAGAASSTARRIEPAVSGRRQDPS